MKVVEDQSKIVEILRKEVQEQREIIDQLKRERDTVAKRVLTLEVAYRNMIRTASDVLANKPWEQIK